MKIKFKLKIPKIGTREIKKIWMIEVVLAGVLLFALLAWDAWIYFKLADAGRNAEGKADSSKVISIKRANLEAADKKLREYKEFLESPRFTP